MRRKHTSILQNVKRILCLYFVLLSGIVYTYGQVIVDHTCTDITVIPDSVIKTVKANLHIAYGHTSHGQQKIEGLKHLDAFMTGKGYSEGLYAVDFDGTSDTSVLDFYDWPWRALGWEQYARDLGTRTDNNNLNFYRDYDAWMYTTRRYLGWTPGSGDGSQLDDYITGTPNYNPGSCNNCNVILWAWCGQVAYNFQGTWSGWNDNWDNEQHHFTNIFDGIPYDLSDGSTLKNLLDEMGVIGSYLYKMSLLEEHYPTVHFVYMTGHVDGQGMDLDWTLNKHNEIMREYCETYEKILYDFADIESYDPDGNYYGDKMVSDACNYDANNDQVLEQTVDAGGVPKLPLGEDRNWAIDWQETHTLGEDWYECFTAGANFYHTQHLNGNLKAYATWWLLAQLTGWNSPITKINDEITLDSDYIIYPNPAESFLIIEVPTRSQAIFNLYNLSGTKVLQQRINTNKHIIDISEYPEGIYLYRLYSSKNIFGKGIIIINNE